MDVTRRVFVATVGCLLPVPGILRTIAASPGSMVSNPCALSHYRFFDAAEARFIEAACERLIPADGSGPGAREAEVATYLDAQLAGPWGAGEHGYREGPWQPGTALPTPAEFTPAALFRATIGAVNREFDRFGLAFADLSLKAQDEFLATLQSGRAMLKVPTAAFFGLLLSMTVEGFFSGVYGATRDRIGWRMASFPGAYASLA